MDVPQPPIPAAWYPDPTDQARHRWWDGSAWTDHVTDPPAPVPDPAPAASSSVALGGESATQDVPTRRQLVDQVGALVTGEADVTASGLPPEPTVANSEFHPESAIRTAEFRPGPAFNTGELRPEPTFEPVEPSWDSDQFGRSAYVPMAPLKVPQPVLTPRPQSSNTLAVWLLAVYPVWIGAVSWAVTQVGALPLTGVRFIVGAVALVLTLVLASADRKRLVARGFDPTAHPAWVLIPLVYFIVRTVRVGRSGVAPLIVFVLLQIGLVAVIIAAGLTSLPSGASA